MTVVTQQICCTGTCQAAPECQVDCDQDEKGRPIDCTGGYVSEIHTFNHVSNKIPGYYDNLGFVCSFASDRNPCVCPEQGEGPTCRRRAYTLGTGISIVKTVDCNGNVLFSSSSSSSSQA